jgi:hypothetical protein
MKQPLRVVMYERGLQALKADVPLRKWMIEVGADLDDTVVLVNRKHHATGGGARATVRLLLSHAHAGNPVQRHVNFSAPDLASLRPQVSAIVSGCGL